ncbi:DUF86 domain-containing protein [Candidatus Poriferisodalis sp.]|uniref:HepT-like ribonuclease domain-containing protein n=1 Tax=Candidatus Poriferisodalis sp. TaxID=3101277 RepID=UPI003B594979
MRLETKKYLDDIGQAARLLTEFIGDKTLADYLSNAMLRAAVERQFEIIGEAMSRLAQKDEAVVAEISGFRRIIAFRNVLIHQYTDVDDRLVWDVAEKSLPTLVREVEDLLGAEPSREAEPASGTQAAGADGWGPAEDWSDWPDESK